jgi:hypothetical protein
MWVQFYIMNNIKRKKYTKYIVFELISAEI